MKRRLMTIGGIGVTATLLAGCGGPSSGGSDDGTYHVVVLGGISAGGVLAENASTSILAARAGADWANAQGGINGQKVTLKVIDDRADPTVAVTKLREEINSEKPDLVLNSGPSKIPNATLQILKQNEILSFNVGPTPSSGDAAEYPLNFDLASSSHDQIAGFVPHLQQQNYQRVGVLHSSTANGVAFGRSADEVLSAGFTVAANEEYDVASLDMTPQLQAIRAKNPDVLILNAYGAPLGYVLKGLQKLDWDIPVVGDLSVSASGLISAPPPSGVLGTPIVENVVMQVFKSTVHNPESTNLNTAVSAMSSLGEIKATLILAYNYDAFPLVAAAADATKSTDPEEIAKALENKDVQDSASTVILGNYNFTPDRHDANPGPKEFVFIPPSTLKDGQFRP